MRQGGTPRRRKKRSPTKKFLEINRHLFPHYGQGANMLKPEVRAMPGGLPSHMFIKDVR